MPAIKQPNKSKVLKKKKSIKLSIWIVIIMIITAILISLLISTLFYEKFRVPRIIAQVQSDDENSLQYQSIYVLNDDATLGSAISEVASLKKVPSAFVASGALTSADDISKLQLARDMTGGTQVTKNITYREDTQDVAVDSSRMVQISFIDMPGVQQGDYIDVHIRKYATLGQAANELATGLLSDGIPDTVAGTYKDEIVLSKKCVYSIVDNTVNLMLTDGDLIRLNAAELDVENDSYTAFVTDTNRYILPAKSELYVTRYVDVEAQPKHEITYNVAQDIYTEVEVEEAMARLERIQNNEPEYNAPTSLGNPQSGIVEDIVEEFEDTTTDAE